jgi:hypothetical protein
LPRDLPALIAGYMEQRADAVVLFHASTSSFE